MSYRIALPLKTFTLISTLWLAACTGELPGTNTPSSAVDSNSNSSYTGDGLQLTSNKVAISGRVLSQAGTGIANATVSASGFEIITDENGIYELENVLIPVGDKLVVQFEKDGFITTQKNLVVQKDMNFGVSATLFPHQYSTTIDPNATTVNNVSATDPADATSTPGTICRPAPRLGWLGRLLSRHPPRSCS